MIMIVSSSNLRTLVISTNLKHIGGDVNTKIHDFLRQPLEFEDPGQDHQADPRTYA